MVSDDDDFEKWRLWRRTGSNAPGAPRAPSEWDRNSSKQTRVDAEQALSFEAGGGSDTLTGANVFDVWQEGLADAPGAATRRNGISATQTHVEAPRARSHAARSVQGKQTRLDIIDLWTEGLAAVRTKVQPALVQRSVGPWGEGRLTAAVQRKALGSADVDPTRVGDVAARGTQDAGAALPYLEQIQRSFGQHDVSNVRAHVGGHAATAAAALGAHAYAHGGAVAFAQAPDLHTAAHEAAHIVQQRTGIAPAGLDGGASDSLERQADAVADAVVAGRSAEELLGPTSRTPSTSAAVQRKSVPGAAAVDGETKYTFRATRGTEFKVAGVPAKLTGNFDFGLKDKGSLNQGGKGLKSAELSTQRLVEKSSDGLDAKIKASLVKGSLDLLTAGQLPAPLSDLPLTVKAEVTGLEAGLSLKKLDVKLMAIAIGIEGDFTTWLPKEVQSHLEVKASLKLEIQVDPKLAKDIVELAKATDEVKEAAELDVKIARTEKKLAELKELASSSSAADLEKIGQGTYRNKLAAEQAARMAAPAEIHELEKELRKLNRLREPVEKLRKKALAQIERIGARLEERAGGRLLKKFAGEAFRLVFKRFLPIYNAISTAKDIYDAAQFLAGLNWDDIGKKIVDGGDGGSSLGDGTHHDGPEGVGGNGDDGQLPDADAIQADLDRREHPVLHPAAQAIVDSVQAKIGSARPGAKELSANDQETINAVVPEDLTPDEIKSVSTQLNAPGTDPQDTVEAVIAAVQRIRPFGEKRGPASDHDEASPHIDAKATATNTKHPAKHKTKAARAASPIVDLAPELAQRVTVDPKTGMATYPPMLKVRGVTFAIVGVKTGRVLAQEDAGAYLVQVQVSVDKVPDGAPLEFPDGVVVAPEAKQTVVFTTAADLTVRATD